MTQTILTTQNITKTYHQQPVLSNVSMTIERGMIYGLIGENGAGKSTLMRIIMGLVRPDKGSIQLFDAQTEQALIHVRRKIGQSIETPALYQELTARQNLEVQATYGGVGTEAIEDLLTLVRLPDTQKKKVKNFSLGMKQRLAIAMSLVTNPELLILDEPTNGLDPSGIVEIREILSRLVIEQGLTVLISSHQLSELSEIATHYGILHQGKLIKEVSREALALETQASIEVSVNDPAAALPVLDDMGIKTYSVEKKNQIRIFNENEQVAQINRALVRQGLDVSRIAVVNQTLEEYFIQSIGGNK